MVAAALAKRARNSSIPRRPASTGCNPKLSTKPRQSSARTVLNYQRSKAAAEDEVAHGVARRIGRRAAQPSQRDRPLRLEHVVAVHKAGGQPAIVSHSARSRLLRRRRCSGARAYRGRREGTDRRELYSRAGPRPPMPRSCRWWADCSVSRPIPTVGRPVVLRARRPRLWNGSRRSPGRSP